jgi:hypothetical protein
MAITESYHERGMKCLWYTYSHDLDPAVIEALKTNGYVEMLNVIKEFWVK